MDINEDTYINRFEPDYPRPQLRRNRWATLNGEWNFAADPLNLGIEQQWFRQPNSAIETSISFDKTIIVPFPPGSPLSQVSLNPNEIPDVVWYHRQISPTSLKKCGLGIDGQTELRLNFEAVDFKTDIWIDGQHFYQNVGGYVPFSVSVPGVSAESPLELVVRAEDQRSNTSQPRGKQTWRKNPDGIWYHPSTGIWRDVWIEAVPPCFINSVFWTTNLDSAMVEAEVEFNVIPPKNSTVKIELEHEGEKFAVTLEQPESRTTKLSIQIPQLLNRQDWTKWLWSPDHPNLLEAKIHLNTDDYHDDIQSYLGLREISIGNRYLYVNRLPVYIRGVLDQGYWPESYFTAPSSQSIKEEISLINSLGFNLSRIHERSPDRRYLYWADRLGIMVWAESASTYRFDTEAVQNVISEWTRLVLRDRSHPSIVTWVPFNESWGVSEISNAPQQQSFVVSVVSLTRTLDPTRPVIANDGWEQLETDMVTTHDYGTSREELLVNYQDQSAVEQIVNEVGPQGRQTLLKTRWSNDRPVIVSEFGGISLVEGQSDAWGYAVVHTAEELAERIRDLFEALYTSPILAGVCYTQLTDTGQETNGLCDAKRRPKIPHKLIRKIVNNHRFQRQQIRPRIINEVPADKENDETNYALPQI